MQQRTDDETTTVDLLDAERCERLDRITDAVSAIQADVQRVLGMLDD